MTKNTVFVDTGAWFAIANANDQHYRRATQHLKTIVEKGERLVTSNLVIHETAMLLYRKLSKEAVLLSAITCGRICNIRPTFFNQDEAEKRHR